jgi:GMP synthase-like glutamine amidotransferase
MHVLIVENMRNTQFGQVGAALAEAQARLDVVRAWAAEPLPASPDGHDAMVVFGGDQNALDDDNSPYLPALARLMHAFGAADKPVLGICLGSQVLARAHGGENLIGVAPEFGWHKVELSRAAAQDPVLSEVPSTFPIFQWHRDTFTLPVDAEHLASNAAVANQCFRIGRASYGMQFHFEADRAVVGKWNSEFGDILAARHPEWLENYDAIAAEHGPAADASGLAIARAWVSLIGSSQPRSESAN